MNSYEIMGQCGVCEREVKRDSAYDTIEWDIANVSIYVCRTCAASYSASELHERLMLVLSEARSEFNTVMEENRLASNADSEVAVLKQAYSDFAEAARVLTECIQNKNGEDADCAEEYPFQESFDEVASSIRVWASHAECRLNKEGGQ